MDLNWIIARLASWLLWAGETLAFFSPKRLSWGRSPLAARPMTGSKPFGWSLAGRWGVGLSSCRLSVDLREGPPGANGVFSDWMLFGGVWCQPSQRFSTTRRGGSGIGSLNRAGQSAIRQRSFIDHYLTCAVQKRTNDPTECSACFS
jgi:hypothetical protein